MTLHDLHQTFASVWVIDFEYYAPSGELPKPICCVAKELFTNRVERLWLWETESIQPEFLSHGPALLVSFYAPAELLVFEDLGWRFAGQIVDVYAECRNLTNGQPITCGKGLLGYAIHFGISTSILHSEKDSMRELAQRGGPWTTEEQRDLLDYCQSDVETTEQLFRRILPDINLDLACLRGRYQRSVAKMEFAGIPMDTDHLQNIRDRWNDIKRELIRETDRDYDVFEGDTFKVDKFQRYINEHGIPWPLTATGKPCLDDDTFKDTAIAYPQLQSLRELRVSLGQL